MNALKTIWRKWGSKQFNLEFFKSFAIYQVKKIKGVGVYDHLTLYMYLFMLLFMHLFNDALKILYTNSVIWFWSKSYKHQFLADLGFWR